MLRSDFGALEKAREPNREPDRAAQREKARPIRASFTLTQAQGLGLAGLFFLAPACERKTAPSGEAAAPASSAESAPSPPPAWATRKPAPATGATITGSVVLIEPAPPAAPQNRGSDAYCSKSGATDESLVVGPGGALRDVMVRVTAGGGGPYAPPSAPAVLTQEGCMYRPRVLGVVEGQEVLVRNGDGTLHNVHALLGPRTLFNKVQVNEQAPAIKFRGEGSATLLKLRCDVHPWMAAYVWTVDQPFFAVTAADGSFALRNLPPGAYTVVAWHERLGTQTASFTIPADGADAKTPPPAPLVFRFSLKNQLTPGGQGG